MRQAFKRLSAFVVTAVLVLPPAIAAADSGLDAGFVPEPGVLGLIAIGGVAAVVLARRKRRK